MGIIDHISDMFEVTSTRKSKRKPKQQTVEIFVKMCCEGCETKVRNSVSTMEGVDSVDVDRKQHRVEVTGFVDPEKVLEKVKDTGKKGAKFWPFVEYNLTYYPYAPQAYDKKAPSGYVRDVDQAYPNHSEPAEKYTTYFSDENVNSCSIM